MKNIVKEYGKNIRKIIWSMTGSYNEDIEQEVYIKAWKNREHYKEQGKLKSWINTITTNLCRDYLKSSYFRISQNYATDENELDRISDKHADLLDEFSSKARMKKIISSIDSLKPKLKEVIILYEMKGFSCEDISQKLKCPMGTVKSRLFNARKELYSMLKDII